MSILFGLGDTMHNAASPFDAYMYGGGFEAASKRGVAQAVAATRAAGLVPATKESVTNAAKIPVKLIRRARR